VSKQDQLYKDAMKMLKKTSRTFYIPITLLGSTLRKTVGSAYLCMRAIDEIEDHPTLDAEHKVELLRQTGDLLYAKSFDGEKYLTILTPYRDILPEVSLRLGDWLDVCPSGIVQRVKEATGKMAYGMADWVKKDFHIRTKEDLDEYTYYVAGLVGEMLSDIWYWYDETKTDHTLAVGYGRGLQAVNILRNEDEDYEERGVNFIPEGWTRADVFVYAKENLRLADEYIKDISNRKILLFCKIPLALAKKTLAAMEKGQVKMSRKEVEETVKEITGE